MSGTQNEIDIKFYPELVKGKLKQGSLILSNNLPVPDSLVSLALLSPQFKEYFENKSTYQALLKLAENNNVSQLMNLPIQINNGVQKAQLSDEEERIFLKDITSNIEKLSTITTFENTFKNMGITLKFLSQALNAFRLWSKENVEGEEQDGEDASDEEAEGLNFNNNRLEVTDEDEKRFEMFESVVDKFSEAQEVIEDLKIDNVCDFLRSKCSKYDCFYTVQEFIKYLIRNLYHLPVDFDYDYNKVMNIFIGLPIYNLNQKLRTDLITWCGGRNWPEEENLTGFEDELKNTGFRLSLWCKQILEILEVFQVYEFDTHQTEERTEFHKGIKEFSVGQDLISFTYAPILAGKMDISLINLQKEVYTTQLTCKAHILDGTDLYRFETIQVSSTNQDALTHTSFKPILEKILPLTKIHSGSDVNGLGGESFDITENALVNANDLTENQPAQNKSAAQQIDYDVSDFALCSKRNHHLASFDYVDDITNPIFFTEDLYYYKIDNLSQLVRKGSNHRLLFVQMTNNYMIPLVVEKEAPLKQFLSYLTVKINGHGFEFKEEDVQSGTLFNEEVINWDMNVEDYYNKIGAVQNQQRASRVNVVNEVLENRNQFIERDENSRLAIMFNLKELLSTGPSYQKFSNDDQINLKINISELIYNILSENQRLLLNGAQQNAGEEPEQDMANSTDEQDSNSQANQGEFTSKFLTAEYIGIGTALHSRKLDILPNFELKSENLPDMEALNGINVSYSPYALLLKSYSGFELVHSANCDGKFMSTNSGNIYSEEELSQKQIAVVYLKKQPVE